MGKQLNLTEIAALVDQLADALAVYHEEAGEFDHDNYQASRLRENGAQDALKERLAAMGARTSARPAVDFAITLGGLRASSTSGVASTCRNWIAAARRRIEAAQ